MDKIEKFLQQINVESFVLMILMIPSNQKKRFQQTKQFWKVFEYAIWFIQKNERERQSIERVLLTKQLKNKNQRNKINQRNFKKGQKYLILQREIKTLETFFGFKRIGISISRVYIGEAITRN